MCRLLLILSFLKSILYLYGQVPDYDMIFENFDEIGVEDLERWTEDMQSELQIININSATLDELMQIYGMTPLYANAILNFRDTISYFLTIYELNSITALPKSFIKFISPWLCFEPTEIDNFTHLFSFRSAVKHFVEGDISSGRNVLGSPYRILFRYKLEHKKWNAGFKAEKDPGEPFGGKYMPQGFDFYSAYAGYHSNGFLRQLYLGDYRVSIGNGLLCNHSFSAGSDASILYHPHDQRVIRMHTSMDEYNFFRGIALRMQSRPFSLTLFGSVKPVDGSIKEIDTIRNRVISVNNIQKTGIHSTVGELRNKHALNEYTSGLVLRWNGRRMAAGINAIYLKYSADVLPAETFNNRYRFKGNSITGCSFDFVYYNRWMGFSGEYAITNSMTAFNKVILLKPNDITAIWTSFRNYSSGYHSPYANSLSRATNIEGERGLGVVVAFMPRWGKTIKAKADIYHIFSTITAPVTGRHGRTFSIERSESKSYLSWLLRLSGEEQTENRNVDPSLTRQLPETHFKRLNIRGEITFHIVESLRQKLRADYRTNSSNGGSSGWLILSETQFRHRKPALRVVFTHALFKTDKYDLRIYCREADALWAYSFVMLYGTGSRTYIMFQYNPIRKIRLWLKVGVTSFVKPSGNFYRTKTLDAAFQLNITI